MNVSATILAFGMSMDAFAASIGKGATLHKPKFSSPAHRSHFWRYRNASPAVRLGMGMLASQFVLEWNHWIAFRIAGLSRRPNGHRRFSRRRR